MVWFTGGNTSSKLCWIVLLQFLNPLVQQCKSCSVALNGVLQLSHSHITEGLSPFSADISAPCHMSATSSSHSSLSQLLRWPLCVCVCVGGLFYMYPGGVRTQHTGEDSSQNHSLTQLLELFSSPPLSLSVLFVSGWWYRKFCRS